MLISETKTIIKSKYEQIDDKVTILLGQKLDYRNRGLFSSKTHDERNSFSGRYSDLRIWKGEISEEQIESLSKCENIVSRGVILDWDIGKYNGNEVNVLEYKNSELCKAYPLKNMAILNHGISHNDIKLLCKTVGDGQLPTFGKSNEDRSNIYKEISELYENLSLKISEFQFSDDQLSKQYFFTSSNHEVTRTTTLPN